jgi:hypothetical protein
MKIRILGNSLRLRLKKSELAIFAENGKISDKIVFGDNELIYSLKVSQEKTIHSYFIDNEIVVSIPKEVAVNWIQSDLISLQNEIATPTLLIEKDFKCTSETCNESETEQEDSFPKPNE